MFLQSQNALQFLNHAFSPGSATFGFWECIVYLLLRLDHPVLYICSCGLSTTCLPLAPSLGSPICSLIFGVLPLPALGWLLAPQAGGTGGPV